MFKYLGLGMSLVGLFGGCEKKTDEAVSSPEGQTQKNAGQGELDLNVRTQSFCQAIPRLPLVMRPETELGSFCMGDLPTELLQKQYDKALKLAEGKYEIGDFSFSHDPDTNFTMAQANWIFRVKTDVAEMRKRDIIGGLSQSLKTSKVEQSSVVTELSQRLSPLHLSSYNLAHHLKILLALGKTMENDRQTQYNVYQVKGGDEGMGLGIEHLTEAENPEYKEAVTLTINFAAPEGTKGSVLLGLMRFHINNHGFPKVVEDVMKDVMDFEARTLLEIFR